MNNLNQWTKDIDQQFQEKVVQRLVQKHRTIALQAFREVITDSRTVGFAHGSPVWTNRFGASHRIAVGAVDGSSLPPHPEKPRWPDEPDSPYKSPALAEASIKLTALRPFEKIFISNSLPYARRLEQGYSKKAPEGIYNITADRMIARYAYTKL